MADCIKKLISDSIFPLKIREIVCYFGPKRVKQASEAHEKTKCFFTDLLISFKGEDVLEYSIEPTRSGTLLYTESCRGLYKNENCALCTDNHSIADCPSFKVLDFRERVSFVADNELCSNCFGEHQVTNCLYVYSCEYCKDMHHSLSHSHLSGIQHSDEHHCSKSGSFDTTEQILNKTLHSIFCTRLESDQTFNSTLDTKPHGTLPCSALSISDSIGENSEVLKQPRLISQNLLCTRLEKDYIFEPKLETAQHDTLSCAIIISSHCLGKSEEVRSHQFTLNFGSNGKSSSDS